MTRKVVPRKDRNVDLFEGHPCPTLVRVQKPGKGSTRTHRESSMPDTHFERTERTRLRRLHNRGHYDRATVYSILEHRVSRPRTASDASRSGPAAERVAVELECDSEHRLRTRPALSANRARRYRGLVEVRPLERPRERGAWPMEQREWHPHLPWYPTKTG